MNQAGDYLEKDKREGKIIGVVVTKAFGNYASKCKSSRAFAWRSESNFLLLNSLSTQRYSLKQLRGLQCHWGGFWFVLDQT